MLDDQEKAKLIWRCRRGMLELDLILKSFIESQMGQLSSLQIKNFKLLLNCTDPELFAWFMGQEEPAQEELQEIVRLIRSHH